MGAGEVPVLKLSGEFDYENVPEIERFLRRHWARSSSRIATWLLDLARVELVDSAFVGLVVSLVASPACRSPRVADPRGLGVTCGATLALVGLPNLVPVYETLDAALEALSVGAPLIPPPFDLAPSAGARRTAP